MSSTTKIVTKPVELKKVEPQQAQPKPAQREGVDVATLRKELQEKKALLNLLEEKGVALPQIDKAAIDKALADLDGIIATADTLEVSSA